MEDIMAAYLYNETEVKVEKITDKNKRKRKRKFKLTLPPSLSENDEISILMDDIMKQIVQINKKPTRKYKKRITNTKSCSHCNTNLRLRDDYYRREHYKICSEMSKPLRDILLKQMNIKTSTASLRTTLFNKSITKKRILEVDVKNMRYISTFYSNYFDYWFLPGKDKYLELLQLPKFDKSKTYTDAWRDFIDEVEKNNYFEEKKQKELYNISKKCDLFFQLNLVKVVNDPELNVKNITISVVEKWFRSLREFKRFEYNDLIVTDTNTKVMKGTEFSTWPKRCGMLDSAFKLKETPTVLKNYANEFKKYMPRTKISEVFVLLKTKEYFTHWHLDVNDYPAFVVLKQLVGETLIFGTYGLLSLYFSSQNKVGAADSVKKSSLEFLTTLNKKGTAAIKGPQKLYSILGPGDCIVVPPNVIHQAHVPDNCEHSVLAAFVYNINGAFEGLKRHGFHFGKRKKR